MIDYATMEASADLSIFVPAILELSLFLEGSQRSWALSLVSTRGTSTSSRKWDFQFWNSHPSPCALFPRFC